ncbi:MAG: hypothetical protein EBR45_01600 [Betaproteobacteria bacterium]|nr:hypothetical protein [Betaproteobacteria bacterium]
MTFDQHRAAEANARLQRTDVEWTASKTGGIYLRPRQACNDWREWKPEPGEIEATHQVVQRAINAGLPMEEWTRLVRSGAITREVRKAMHGMDQAA